LGSRVESEVEKEKEMLEFFSLPFSYSKEVSFG
jgi:hypothetical protein